MKKHLNPAKLINNPAFSQVVTTQGNGRTIYIGGQNAVNSNYEIIGKGDLAKQTEQVMTNIEVALQAAGAGFDDLVKLTIYMLAGQDAQPGFAASQKFLGNLKEQPIVSVLFVSGFAHPDFLLEIDAIAYVLHVEE